MCVNFMHFVSLNSPETNFLFYSFTNVLEILKDSNNFGDSFNV